MKNIVGSVTLWVVASTLTAHLQTSFAEDVPTSPLATIIVTATRQATDIQTTPVAVSAFTGADLELANVREFADLMDAIPGVQAPKGLNGSGASITIRGIGSNARLGLGDGVEQPAGAYLDQVFVGPRSFLDYALFDVGQIEVLRGPQGTLWGRNTSSGAVTYTTRRPTNDWEGYFDVRLGDYGLRSYEGAVSGPIVADQLTFRLSGLSEERDGYVRDLSGGSFANVNQKSVRGQLMYKPNSDLTAVLIAQYLRSRTIPPIPCWYGLPGYTGPAALNVCSDFTHEQGAVNVNGFVNQDLYSVTALVDLGMGDYKFTSVTGYFKSELTSIADDEGSSLDIQEDTIGLDGHPNTIERVTQELRFVTPRYSGRLDFTGGLYYYQERSKSSTATRTGTFIFDSLGIGLPFGAVAESSLAQTIVETTSYAAFGQTNLHFVDAFWLTLGGRYNRDVKTFESTSGTDLLDASNAVVFEQSFGPLTSLPDYRNSVFTGLATLNYQPTADSLFYLTYSQGYKAGGFNTDYVIGQSVVSPFYGPERAVNVEAGARTSWFDRRLDANATVFRMNYNDLQVQVQDVTANGILVGQVANAARARSQGLELEVAAEPTPQWHLRFAASVLDAKFTDYPTDGGNLSGNRLPFAPQATAKLTARYEFPLLEQFTAYVQGEGNFNDGYYTDTTDQPNGHQAAYTEINARIGFRQNRTWEVGLWARNLTNKRVITDYNPVIEQTPAIFRGSSFLVFASPFTFGADVHFNFR